MTPYFRPALQSSLLALILLLSLGCTEDEIPDDDDSAPSDDDDSTPSDDDDSGDDDDTTWTGGLIQASVWNDLSKDPIPGVVVSARGSVPFVTTTTDGNGDFEMTVTDEGDLDLELVKDGFLSTLVFSTVEHLDTVLLLIEISDFEFPLDPAKGLVKVEPRGKNSEFGGFTADLSCKYSSVWVLDASDEFVPGNTILGDGTYTVVYFVGVEPGDCQFTFSAPPIASCHYRTDLDILANYLIDVPVVCNL